MTAALSMITPDAATTSAAASEIDLERLAIDMAGRSCDAVTAVLGLVDAAESGQVNRVVTAATGLRAELDILIDSLSPYSRDGVTVDPHLAATALETRLSTAIYLADLARR